MVGFRYYSTLVKDLLPAGRVFNDNESGFLYHDEVEKVLQL